MQATCCTKVLDKPLAPLHQYSQWVPSFKTPYSCKLHKQIVIDHSGGVSLDSQSKQLYMKSKPPGGILTHTHRFNRHLKQHFCHCVTSLLYWQCKRTFVIFWGFFFRGCCQAHYGWVPSIPVRLQEPAVFYINMPEKFAENEKWNRWVLYLCEERSESGWAAL